MGLHVRERGSGRHPHSTCMLSEKDKLEFSYRSSNFENLVENNYRNPPLHQGKKIVGYFSGTVDWCVCPQPSLPPSPHLVPPPTPALLLALLAVSRLRCQQSSTSSSKSAAFFFIAVCGYLTPLPGQQILCPIQQLERYRLLDQDLEGAQTPPTNSRSSPPLTTIFALGLYKGRQLP